MAKKSKQFIIPIVMLTLIAAAIYFGYRFLESTHSKASPLAETVETVKPQDNTSSLFFSGNITPLHIYSVTSPIAGTAVKLNFQYGQEIHVDQYLLSINSDKSESDYRDALTGYLKAKDSYLNSTARFLSQQFLYDNGLVPRNDFQSSRSELETNELSYRQAIFTLQSSIGKIMADTKKRKQLFDSLTQLTLGDKAVNQALSMQFSILKIHSAHSGIALFPAKDSGGDSTAIYEGAVIKPGAVLVSIGDMSGLSVPIAVSEINVNKIKPGQRVVVTSIAFPNITLKGYVATVDAQAKTDGGDSSGLPSFPVTVIVPNLTDEQRKVIHVGMTAQVTLEISNPKQILVPITAVQQTSHGNFVTVMRDGKKQTVEVITGETTLTHVTIVHGLEAGDQLVEPNSTK